MNSPTAPDNTTQPTVLMIYDSEVIRQTVSLLAMDRDRYRVVEISTPGEAQEACEREAPDLIVLCAMSKRTKAYQVCKAIKEAQGPSFTPVVIFALKLGPEEREKALEANADDIFAVTMPPEDVQARMQALLRIRQGVLESTRRSQSLARASAEAADTILQLAEANRRIQEQNQEIKARDARIQLQQKDIEKHLATLQKELELASRLQVSLLPSAADYPGDVTIADQYVPAADLGGDYYDYVEREDGSLFVMIADVTGHGVAPALVGVQSRTQARAALARDPAPASVMADLNQFMFQTFKREFLMTAFGLIYEPGTGAVRYCGAGHCPLVLLRAGTNTTEEIGSKGLPLGVTGKDSYQEGQLTLAPGDRLFLYTDGINEATSPANEEYGVQRMLDAFVAARDKAPAETLAHMMEAVRVFHGGTVFDDDVTLVLMERDAPAP